jgi:RNA polymerase sigma-70 factor (ECF subfamily)
MSAWTEAKVTTERSAAADVDTDTEAEELFKRVYPTLAGWVRRLVGDDDIAHEISSEAFVRLLSRLIGVKRPQSFLCERWSALLFHGWPRSSPGAGNDAP